RLHWFRNLEFVASLEGWGWACCCVTQVQRSRPIRRISSRRGRPGRFGKMRIEILSFTIKDIYDRVDYLNSAWPHAQTAIVVESKCQRSRMEVRYEMGLAYSGQRQTLPDTEGDFDVEVNRAKAQAELAYNLQSAKERQRIRTGRRKLKLMLVSGCSRVREKRKLIEIEEKEIIRNEKELDAIVRRPAEAQAFQCAVLPKPPSIEAVGKARRRPSAPTGDAAVLELTLDALPKVAAEVVAAPLARIDEIVVLGDDRTTSEALTGVDLSKAIGRLPGATVAGSA
uniref:Radixin n=1 Tax=Macrostomum lignano TaxID=282301 RepID=A0A1I8F6B2_9PLAT